MLPISSKQIQYAKALMRQQNIIDVSAELALQFSNGRTEHVSELSSGEGIELIRSLTPGSPAHERRAAEEKMRRKVISMAREMGWVLTDTSTGKIELKADMGRIQNWCEVYGYLHKELNEYTFEELPTLVSQFGILHKQYLNEL